MTLGISTSSSRFAIVLGEDGHILFNSEDQDVSADLKNIDHLLNLGLESIERNVREISKIIVDKGPGGTSSVRTGVAYANALAFSLGIETYAISSFELLGIKLYAEYEIPVILSAKSIKGNAFIGIFDDHKIQSISYGELNTILKKVVDQDRSYVASGLLNEKIKELLPDVEVLLSEKRFGDVAIFIEKEDSLCRNALKYPKFVVPITEKNLNHD